ncbi:Fe-S cluster assembly protein SufD [Candidatus Regiella endosymbiont of Tuberolachnus salignus]|uniref:Fe-S cluster assembly protein SufD n=1 Tax=Candidatus Regiella endosymbiont of Tuberolachnus salignus TaxID=3077956 RepID=UPI0030D3B7AC
MAGLLPNSDPFKQFGQLFQQRSNSASDAQMHWQQVMQLGFPHNKHEDWKYTPLDRLLQHDFSYATTSAISINKQRCDELALPLEAHRLVFIDGKWAPSLSDSHCDPYQICVLTEKESLPAAIRPEIFLHLTESLAQEKVLIRLAAGKKAAKPLYLLHIDSGQAYDKNENRISSSYYRHHLVIEPHASAQVIEHFVSHQHHAHFTNARLTMAVGDNAQLTHCKLAFETAQSYHFSHNDVILGRHARAHSDSFLLGAGLTRHHTSSKLNGEGGDVSINSLLLPLSGEIADSRSYLEHNTGHCQSRQLHKMIVQHGGTAVFNGLLKVSPRAVKTDGQMTNNNLLLSQQAFVATKPQLEIYADDVKCSHGATVGRISAEQLFYLQSRGINQAEAKKMIIFAFAAELTETLENNLIRQQVIKRITDRLAEKQP